MATTTRRKPGRKKLKRNAHDFKYAKKRVLKNYAKRHSLRAGTPQYNAYVHGSIAHRMAGKYKKRHAH